MKPYRSMPATEPPPPPAGHSWLPFVLVLGLLGFVLAGSFMLAGIELTLAIAGVSVVLGGAAAFHYIVWGWWLSRYLREDVEADEGQTDGGAEEDRR